MAEQRSDDLLRSRQEAALLLRLDPQNLSPSDALRCDLIATLRLSIDSAQADALEGRAADLGRLIVATESLVKLLPSDPPKPEVNRADPRVALWNIIKEGRDRLAEGYEGYDGKVRQVAALQAEVAALKAQLMGAGLTPALPDVADRQVGTSGNLKTAITPPTCDITPPNEIGKCNSGRVVGPDDWRAQRSPVTIEGKAVTPAPAASAAPPSRPQNFDDTPNGKAWQAWHDAGGSVGGDRWSNRNIP
jgi:hypothetical protein